MERWLAAALDYIPRWLAHQMRLHRQPGVAIAVAWDGKTVLDLAFGHADATRGAELTPRHRFRVASHSKTFTAAGILKLREQDRLGLDDRIGRYVPGLHPRVARATLAQLLSHGAGLVRDGADTGQWVDRRPFKTQAEILADLADGPAIDPNTRFKYSNHGFGLAGMAIEAVTGEPYRDWIAREIVAASGLEETLPDVPLARGSPLARGHSATLPLDRRVMVPGDNPTNGLAAATGFVSTASDLARFFAALDPAAKRGVLSPESRREMLHRRWREPHSALGRWYGLGTISGTYGGGPGPDWDWAGHSGGFQGHITRTACLPGRRLAVSVLTNAADGLSHPWLDGAVSILRAYAAGGAPSRATAGWTGRWWSLWGAVDLVPLADKVLVAAPGMFLPLLDASEIAVEGAARGRVRRGRIVQAGGFASHGEAAELRLDARGRPVEAILAGSKGLPEEKVRRELEARYGTRKARARR